MAFWDGLTVLVLLNISCCSVIYMFCMYICTTELRNTNLGKVDSYPSSG